MLIELVYVTDTCYHLCLERSKLFIKIIENHVFFLLFFWFLRRSWCSTGKYIEYPPTWVERKGNSRASRVDRSLFPSNDIKGCETMRKAITPSRRDGSLTTYTYKCRMCKVKTWRALPSRSTLICRVVSTENWSTSQEKPHAVDFFFFFSTMLYVKLVTFPQAE